MNEINFQVNSNPFLDAETEIFKPVIDSTKPVDDESSIDYKAKYFELLKSLETKGSVGNAPIIEDMNSLNSPISENLNDRNQGSPPAMMFDVVEPQKKAAKIISSLMNDTPFEEDLAEIDMSLVGSLSILLDVDDLNFLTLILKAIYQILVKTYKNQGIFSKISDAIQSHGGLCTLKQLQKHEHDPTADLAYDIIHHFFGTDVRLLFSLKEEISGKDPSVDALIELSHLADSGNDQREAIHVTQIIRSIVPLIHHSQKRLKIAALRVIANVMTGTVEQRKRVFEYEIVGNLVSLFKKPDNDFTTTKEILRCIANVSKGKEPEIHRLFEDEVISAVIRYIRNHDGDMRKHALNVVYSFAQQGSPNPTILFQKKAIEPLCWCLQHSDVPMLKKNLETLQLILSNVPGSQKKVAKYGLMQIQKLHENDQVRETVYAMIDKYFPHPACQLLLVLKKIRTEKTAIPVYTVWQLAHILGSYTFKEEAMKREIMLHIKILLTLPNVGIQIATLQCAINLARSKIRKSELLINNYLKDISKLLTHPHPVIRSYALRFIHHMTEGTTDSNYLLFQDRIIFTVLIFLEDDDVQVQKNALQVILNIVYTSKMDHIKALIEMGIIPQLCRLLTSTNLFVTLHALRILSYIVSNAGDKIPLIDTQIIDGDGVAMAKALRSSSQLAIREEANDFIRVFEQASQRPA